MNNPWLLFLATMTISALLTWWLASSRSPFKQLDQPNERSLHTIPTPHTGGLAVVAALSLTLGLKYLLDKNGGMGLEQTVIGAGLLTLLSLWDDHAPLSAKIRLLFHLAAALLLIHGQLVLTTLEIPGYTTIALGWGGTLLTIPFVIWILNLYNFMDGMDGFAGGMALFGFGCFAILGWMAGDDLFAISALVIAAANLGFLLFNFPPARIFMGDAGSVPIGFLVAAFILWGVRDEIFPLWVALLIFAPFFVDATVVVIRRLINGEKIWEAHRSHYYQRLAWSIGWGHRRTVLVEYLLMLTGGGSAIMMVHWNRPTYTLIGLAGWGIIYLLLAQLVRRMEANRMKPLRKKT